MSGESDERDDSYCVALVARSCYVSTGAAWRSTMLTVAFLSLSVYELRAIP